jgi:preprotein translocase subunit SecD
VRRCGALAGWGGLLLVVGGCTWNAATPTIEERSRPAPVSLTVHRASTTEQEGYKPVLYEGRVTVHVDPRPVLTDADVWNARAFDGERRGLVELELTAPGTMALAQVTRSSQGGLLAVFVDAKLEMLSRVGRPIEDGRVILSADFSPARAREIAAALNMQRAARSPLRRSSER